MSEPLDITGDRFMLRYDLRQRSRARQFCRDGHDMRTRFSFHVGSWRLCVRCSLIIPLAARNRPAPHLKVRRPSTPTRHNSR